MFDLLEFLKAFAQDQRTLTLVGLMALDLLFGTAAAIKSRSWDIEAVGLWYEHNVAPYLLCYLGLYVVTQFGLTPLLGDLVGDISAYAAATPAILSLVGSIGRNAKLLSASAEAAG